MPAKNASILPSSGGLSMALCYRYRSRVGPFYITRDCYGRFHGVYECDDLGGYADVCELLHGLTAGETFAHSLGWDTCLAGLPENIGEWERVSEQNAVRV